METKIRMTPTPESSHVASFGYDDKTATLYVRYKHRGDAPIRGGKIYKYQNVPREKYAGLRNAVSKGLYLRNFIRDVFPGFVLKDPSPVVFVEDHDAGSRAGRVTFALKPKKDPRWAW